MNPTFAKGERYKKNRDFQIFPVIFRENLQSALEYARVTSGVCTCCIGDSARVTSRAQQIPLFHSQTGLYLHHLLPCRDDMKAK